MENLTNFANLLSEKRLASYNNDIIKHYDNLKLIGKITPKIATLEIILRNKLNNILLSKDSEWIKNSEDLKITEEIKKIEDREKRENDNNDIHLSHHQYLSRLSLGIIIRTINQEKLRNQVMDLKKIKFKKYDDSNRDFFFNNGKKLFFRNTHKVDIALSLLQNLRNRSYHWENIMKTARKENEIYPRITTKVKDTHIGINPNKIEVFLEDLIKAFDKKFLDYC